MKRDSKQLAENIIAMVLELANIAGEKSKTTRSKNQKDASGAIGGLRFLVNEGYFDSPKQLSGVIENLKQEGRHYSNATVSMGLLNLVRERVLTRFRDKGDKKWNYVIRK